MQQISKARELPELDGRSRLGCRLSSTGGLGSGLAGVLVGPAVVAVQPCEERPPWRRRKRVHLQPRATLHPHQPAAVPASASAKQKVHVSNALFRAEARALDLFRIRPGDGHNEPPRRRKALKCQSVYPGSGEHESVPESSPTHREVLSERNTATVPKKRGVAEGNPKTVPNGAEKQRFGFLFRPICCGLSGSRCSWYFWPPSVRRKPEPGPSPLRSQARCRVGR